MWTEEEKRDYIQLEDFRLTAFYSEKNIGGNV